MSERSEPAAALDHAVLHQLVTDLDAETAARLVAAFVDEMVARTERIAQAAAAGQAAALQHEAHALKSSAGTYGARAVSEAARDIETLCRQADLTGAARLVEPLPALTERAAAAFAVWREEIGRPG